MKEEEKTIYRDEEFTLMPKTVEIIKNWTYGDDSTIRFYIEIINKAQDFIIENWDYAGLITDKEIKNLLVGLSFLKTNIMELNESMKGDIL